MFRLFVAMRLAVGGLSYVAPGLAGRMFGFRGGDESPYWARLFGVRDVALAAGALATTGDARRQIVQLTGACDAADVVSTLAGRRGGYLSPTTAALSTALAVTAGAVAAAAAAEVAREG